MSKPISKTKEQIWNERFEKKRSELNLTQQKFSTLYKERFGTGSQADVSKWMHVGETDSRTNKGRRFPKFETMRNIAEILGVSVGYLIGETDYDSFEEERASRYMRLSPEAIKGIRAVTTGKAIPPFYKYPDPQKTAALEVILTNPSLVDYLTNICELAEAINRRQNPKGLFEKAVERIPEEYRADVIALWKDPEKTVNTGVEATETLWAFVNMLDGAAYEETYQPDTADREIKSAKYALEEAHIQMVNETIADNNLPKLLPHYATK